MKFVFSSLIMSGMLAGFAFLQPPGGQQGEGRGPRQGGGGGEETITRVMSLDKNKDGVLTEDEYSESRLKGLVERADADKNKEVTREEVAQLVQKEMAGRGGEGGPGGRGGFGEDLVAPADKVASVALLVDQVVLVVLVVSRLWVVSSVGQAVVAARWAAEDEDAGR